MEQHQHTRHLILGIKLTPVLAAILLQRLPPSIKDIVNSNRAVVIHNQVQHQVTNNHQHTSLLLREAMAVAKVAAIVLVEVTKVVGTKEAVDMVAVVVGTDSRALMGRAAAVVVMEEADEVVAEEVADRVDTIVVWVMVIHLVVDIKKRKSTRQIKCLCPTWLPP